MARERDFSLFSFLEQAAAGAQLKDRVVYLKPSRKQGRGAYREEVVEMKLQGIGIGQLVTLLEAVEGPDHLLAVRRCVLQRGKDREEGLDVILQVVTLKPKDGA